MPSFERKMSVVKWRAFLIAPSLHLENWIVSAADLSSFLEATCLLPPWPPVGSERSTERLNSRVVRLLAMMEKLGTMHLPRKPSGFRVLRRKDRKSSIGTLIPQNRLAITNPRAVYTCLTQKSSPPTYYRSGFIESSDTYSEPCALPLDKEIENPI